MILRVRENIDFLLGGSLIATAPFFPRVCEGMTTGQFNDVLTLLIQGLSVVLIVMRIKKVNETDERQDTKDS